jgi:hypothetical protein
MKRLLVHSFVTAALAMALGSGPAAARPRQPLSTLDSFRIGSSGVLCTAQNLLTDPALTSMFDRGYSIVCRDAATSVGSLYALRNNGSDPVAALNAKHKLAISCAAAAPAVIEGVGAVASRTCADPAGVVYKVYSIQAGKTLYMAEGLGGYDSALRLGLVSLVKNAAVPGEVQVATTSAGDPAAFARVQAGTLDANRALAEAYTRNNNGSYAEAAEFFELLSQRRSGSSDRTAEYLVNQALQQSNLGDFATADASFGQAERAINASDGVTQRLLRNFRALHQLNQKRPKQALVELDRRVAAIVDNEGDPIATGYISPSLADQINRENKPLERLGGMGSQLSPFERAAILDGQALALRGTALRLSGRNADARKQLLQAEQTVARVRNGRISSTTWLRASIQSELALIAESDGDHAAAERSLSGAVRLYEIGYPQSAALLTAKARLAAFLGRRGEADRALALYAEVTAASEGLPGAAVAMRDLLAPYFALLIARGDSDPKAVAATFAASQMLQRSGVAQTQALLARELSEGDDEASALFRLSVTRTREIARANGQIARLAAKPRPTAEEVQALATARAALIALENEQTALQSRLSAYPRYRVIAPQAVPLAELQAALREGEAYYKLILAGNDAYALFVTPTAARSFRIAETGKQIEQDVAKLRDSVVHLEDGAPTTFPFDVVLARALYVSLFGPLAEEIGRTRHLIFEPDGPMLQLPPNLLVTDQAGVDAYLKRIARPSADEFDFRGVQWLGRGRDISIAVSPRSFTAVRAIAPSTGSMSYLGLGNNARPSLSGMMPAAASQGDCGWPLSSWEHPISPRELTLAADILGASRSTLMTSAAFSDSALIQNPHLADYRIIHFATHGLVTAPRPECPARPALLTSFGGAESDGLLTFKEIYDLKLDADVVILSACDTAGMATIAATREAGITTGGNYALDGLVRAFVGAGARSVIASHWPVPDDYSATERLISGMFRAPAGTSMATALRLAQQELMEDANTSHPYYWSAFSIIGDGTRALIKK